MRLSIHMNLSYNAIPSARYAYINAYLEYAPHFLFASLLLHYTVDFIAVVRKLANTWGKHVHCLLFDCLLIIDVGVVHFCLPCV